MADDDGTGAPPATDPGAARIDIEELKAALREVLPEFLGGDDGDLDPAEAGDDGESERPITVRDLEAATEKAVRDAMKVLQASAKPKPKPRSTASDGDAGSGGTSGAGGAGSGSGSHSEPPPTPPPPDLRARLRKVFVGE